MLYGISDIIKNIFEFKYEDFTLVDYDPEPSIKADVGQETHFGSKCKSFGGGVPEHLSVKNR